LDSLTFVAEIVKALAWPTSILLLVLTLRKPIGELIPFLRKLKYKEIEMEFSCELAELKAEVLPVLEQFTRQDGTSHGEQLAATCPKDRLGNKYDELIHMANFSTRVAIMDSLARS